MEESAVNFNVKEGKKSKKFSLGKKRQHKEQVQPDETNNDNSKTLPPKTKTKNKSAWKSFFGLFLKSTSKKEGAKKVPEKVPLQEDDKEVFLNEITDDFAMAISLPKKVEGKDVNVSIELKAISKTDLAESVKNDVDLRVVQESPSKTIFSGNIKVPSRTTIEQISKMPLYFVNAEKTKSQDGQESHKIETMIKPLENNMPINVDQTMIVQNINLKVNMTLNTDKNCFENFEKLNFIFITNETRACSLHSIKTKDIVEEITQDEDEKYDEQSKAIVKEILTLVVNKVHASTEYSNMMATVSNEINAQKTLLIKRNSMNVEDEKKLDLLSNISEKEEEHDSDACMENKKAEDTCDDAPTEEVTETAEKVQPSEETLYPMSTTCTSESETTLTQSATSIYHLRAPTNTPITPVPRYAIQYDESLLEQTPRKYVDITKSNQSPSQYKNFERYSYVSAKHTCGNSDKVKNVTVMRENLRADIDKTLELLETAKNKLLSYLHQPFEVPQAPAFKSYHSPVKAYQKKLNKDHSDVPSAKTENLKSINRSLGNIPEKAKKQVSEKKREEGVDKKATTKKGIEKANTKYPNKAEKIDKKYHPKQEKAIIKFQKMDKMPAKKEVPERFNIKYQSKQNVEKNVPKAEVPEKLKQQRPETAQRFAVEDAVAKFVAPNTTGMYDAISRMRMDSKHFTDTALSLKSSDLSTSKINVKFSRGASQQFFLGEAKNEEISDIITFPKENIPPNLPITTHKPTLNTIQNIYNTVITTEENLYRTKSETEQDNLFQQRYGENRENNQLTYSIVENDINIMIQELLNESNNIKELALQSLNIKYSSDEADANKMDTKVNEDVKYILDLLLDRTYEITSKAVDVGAPIQESTYINYCTVEETITQNDSQLELPPNQKMTPTDLVFSKNNVCKIPKTSWNFGEGRCSTNTPTVTVRRISQQKAPELFQQDEELVEKLARGSAFLTQIYNEMCSVDPNKLPTSEIYNDLTNEILDENEDKKNTPNEEGDCDNKIFDKPDFDEKPCDENIFGSTSSNEIELIEKTCCERQCAEENVINTDENDSENNFEENDRTNKNKIFATGLCEEILEQEKFVNNKEYSEEENLALLSTNIRKNEKGDLKLKSALTTVVRKVNEDKEKGKEEGEKEDGEKDEEERIKSVLAAITRRNENEGEEERLDSTLTIFGRRNENKTDKCRIESDLTNFASRNDDDDDKEDKILPIYNEENYEKSNIAKEHTKKTNKEEELRSKIMKSKLTTYAEELLRIKTNEEKIVTNDEAIKDNAVIISCKEEDLELKAVEDEALGITNGQEALRLKANEGEGVITTDEKEELQSTRIEDEENVIIANEEEGLQSKAIEELIIKNGIENLRSKTIEDEAAITPNEEKEIKSNIIDEAVIRTNEEEKLRSKTNQNKAVINEREDLRAKIVGYEEEITSNGEEELRSKLIENEAVITDEEDLQSKTIEGLIVTSGKEKLRSKSIEDEAMITTNEEEELRLKTSKDEEEITTNHKEKLRSKIIKDEAIPITNVREELRLKTNENEGLTNEKEELRPKAVEDEKEITQIDDEELRFKIIEDEAAISDEEEDSQLKIIKDETVITTYEKEDLPTKANEDNELLPKSIKDELVITNEEEGLPEKTNEGESVKTTIDEEELRPISTEEIFEIIKIKAQEVDVAKNINIALIPSKEFFNEMIASQVAAMIKKKEEVRAIVPKYANFRNLDNAIVEHDRIRLIDDEQIEEVFDESVDFKIKIGAGDDDEENEICRCVHDDNDENEIFNKRDDILRETNSIDGNEMSRNLIDDAVNKICIIDDNDDYDHIKYQVNDDNGNIMYQIDDEGNRIDYFENNIERLDANTVCQRHDDYDDQIETYNEFERHNDDYKICDAHQFVTINHDDRICDAFKLNEMHGDDNDDDDDKICGVYTLDDDENETHFTHDNKIKKCRKDDENILHVKDNEVNEMRDDDNENKVYLMDDDDNNNITDDDVEDALNNDVYEVDQLYDDENNTLLKDDADAVKTLEMDNGGDKIMEEDEDILCLIHHIENLSLDDDVNVRNGMDNKVNNVTAVKVDVDYDMNKTCARYEDEIETYTDNGCELEDTEVEYSPICSNIRCRDSMDYNNSEVDTEDDANISLQARNEIKMNLIRQEVNALGIVEYEENQADLLEEAAMLEDENNACQLAKEKINYNDKGDKNRELLQEIENLLTLMDSTDTKMSPIHDNNHKLDTIESENVREECLEDCNEMNDYDDHICTIDYENVNEIDVISGEENRMDTFNDDEIQMDAVDDYDDNNWETLDEVCIHEDCENEINVINCEDNESYTFNDDEIEKDAVEDDDDTVNETSINEDYKNENLDETCMNNTLDEFCINENLDEVCINDIETVNDDDNNIEDGVSYVENQTNDLDDCCDEANANDEEEEKNDVNEKKSYSQQEIIMPNSEGKNENYKKKKCEPNLSAIVQETAMVGAILSSLINFEDTTGKKISDKAIDKNVPKLCKSVTITKRDEELPSISAQAPSEIIKPEHQFHVLKKTAKIAAVESKVISPSHIFNTSTEEVCETVVDLEPTPFVLAKVSKYSASSKRSKATYASSSSSEEEIRPRPIEKPSFYKTTSSVSVPKSLISNRVKTYPSTADDSSISSRTFGTVPDSDYDGDQDTCSLVFPRFRHEYVSLQELNNKEEIEYIEENVKTNDDLNIQSQSSIRKLQKNKSKKLIVNESYESMTTSLSIDSESRSEIQINTN